MTPETLQKELPVLMKKYNVRAEYLALKLNLSYATIIHWTRGTRTPKQPTIDKLEQIFNGFKSIQKRRKASKK